MGSQMHLEQLHAMLRMLIDILVAKGTLGERHRRLLDRVWQNAGHTGVEVRLETSHDDKYAVVGADIDCASRLTLCKARCCTLSVPLSIQDLEEGLLSWEWKKPYVMRRDRDGYCQNIDRATGMCSCHERRPAVCRLYDCRNDPRVWVDFDKRIAAPMPEGVVPLELSDTD